MAQLAGKNQPTEKDITAILEAGGIEVDSATLKLVLKALDGRDASEVPLENDRSKNFESKAICWFAAKRNGGAGCSHEAE